MSGARILVVDDEPSMLRLLRRNLEARGYVVDGVEEAGAGLELARASRFDVMILDLNLPDMDGVDLLRSIREHSDLPVIVLSARETERDRVVALDAGADDYVSKPFGIDELMARVRVALRRIAPPASTTVWEGNDLRIDFERRRVLVHGRAVHLTPTEYNLLKALVRHRDRVLTDRILLQEVWGPEYGDESHYLHVYIARLRKKIEVDPQHPRHLLTEPGVGYRLVGDDPPST